MASVFHYAARTPDGELVRGAMEAADDRAVVDALRNRALFVTSVEREHALFHRARAFIDGRRASHTAQLGFFRSFVTLMRAGVSIARSLRVTIERAGDERLREALRSVLADVEQGASLSDAMGRRPRDFAPLHVAMIRAGEAGGILDDVLERLALLLEREAALRKNVRTALTYPLIVLIAAGALVIFLLVKIVPMFATMFAGFGVDVPPATQVLLAAAGIATAPSTWAIVAVAIPALGFAAFRFARHPAGAEFFDALLLRLPVVGALVHKAIMARVARMLATLLRSGVELVTAIEAIVPVTGSIRYARAFEGVIAGLRDGESLAETLARAHLFDPLFLALVRVGEEAGRVDEMLAKCADYFESDVAAAIATLGAALEPALIIILGGIVGFIVLCIFIPLYSLIGTVSK